MNTLFPFGFPWQTTLYLVLYVVTLCIHVAFMNYVLAGTGYLAISALFPGGAKARHRGPLADTLRDWMPFMLSAAITAGVAPLLFVQLLYKYNFYTANLLGFHRWMAILPVLIVGFYALYLMKGKGVGGRSMAWRTALGALSFLLFAFVAWSWTENYLLSMADKETWAREYVEQRVFYRDAQQIPRLGVWFIGALPTMALLVSWQLWYAQKRGDQRAGNEARLCAMLALGGMVGALTFGIIYFIMIDRQTRQAVFSMLALPYFILAIAGAGLQVWAWWKQMMAPSFDRRWLTWISIGTALTVLGMTVVREAIRIRLIDITTFYERHATVLSRGGWSIVVFLLFFVGNIAVIAWCFKLVRPAWSRSEGDAPHAAADQSAEMF